MNEIHQKLSGKIKLGMSEYWTSRAEKFSQLKIEELNSNIRIAWENELQCHLPNSKSLKILDIGTGTGFFSFLLAVKGHDLTGIDLTEDMINQAKNTSEILQIPVDFHVMDAENLKFSDNSFDVIVTRNVTWTLPNLENAYKDWYRVLKKNGILINIDGDYCREENVELPENHAHKKITDKQWNDYENLKSELRIVSKPRPDWDINLLKDIGFENIILDKEVGNRIYIEKDKFYNPTPIFKIVCQKISRDKSNKL